MDQEVFWEKMRQIVREEVARHAAIPVPVQQEKAYTIREFCNRFQISKPTLYEWIKMGKISPVKIGRRVFFKKSDVEALMA